VGETRVDLLHLLQDLADAYPGDLEETILTEIVANSLDSGASRLSLGTDTAARTFTAIDDGQGMRRADLRRFHDIAATSKTRGEGIGFAGVGIKLGLLVSEAVITETQRGQHHLATTWALSGRQRAPWRWVDPPGMVRETGTAVRLQLQNPLSPLLDAGYIEAALRRHFEPLFDESLDEILGQHYPCGVRFEINGRDLNRLALSSRATNSATLALRIARRRKPSAFGFLVREPLPVAEELRGVAISTFGKVIKRGWDWLGITPAAPELVRGLVETPALAACLTLNKADFIRSGPRGATYLAHRKALQEAVSEQLARWGDDRADREPPRHRITRPVERDVERVLIDLSRRFPLLAALVDRRPGGNRKMAAASGRNGQVGMLPLALGLEGEPPTETGQETPPAVPQTPEEASPAPPEPRELSPAPAQVPGRVGAKRPARLGLTIQLESRVGDPELGRLVESTVWVNDAHPAYRRAAASRAEGYHLALSVAMALSSVAVEAGQQHAFVTEFMSYWGESVGNGGPRRRRKRSS
jgi:hypothetical protein